MFYDAVRIIYPMIITHNPYTAKFMFVSVRSNRGQEIRC